ncbi:MAG: NADH-quinone oxidoreductase subunit A [Cytophagaceae bacterium]
MIKPDLSQFGIILLFLAAGILLPCVLLLFARLIRANRPNYEKLTTYESGEEAKGNAWGQFNIRFYVIALIFIMFEVEIVFLFPWTTISADKQMIQLTGGAWLWYNIAEVLIFVAILALGLAYAWIKGYLDWIKPAPAVPAFESPVPDALYQQINKKYSGSKGDASMGENPEK